MELLATRQWTVTPFFVDKVVFMLYNVLVVVLLYNTIVIAGHLIDRFGREWLKFNGAEKDNFIYKCRK